MSTIVMRVNHFAVSTSLLIHSKTQVIKTLLVCQLELQHVVASLSLLPNKQNLYRTNIYENSLPHLKFSLFSLFQFPK